jgi:hypothetical protein
MRALRRHLVERGVKNECIAIRRTAPFEFVAVDGCSGTRLGTFRVDAKTLQLTTDN